MSTVNHNLNNKPVGFFDSGVGGLSVYSKFKQILPCENTIYFGDLKHLPYGNKSRKELVEYAREILDFYKTKNVKAVVIACNTSSAQAYELVKDYYDFKIYPIIQSCAQVISGMGYKRVGVFATEATVKSGVYTRELKKYRADIEVKEIACPNWVGIVEGVFTGSKEADIKVHMDEMLKFKPDKIILGCTHYPYLLNELKTLAPADMFIDPAEIFVKFIQKDLPQNTDKQNGNEEIFVSANPESFVEHSKIFYNVSKLPQLINLSS